MSTRGSLIILEENKCTTGYVHFGGDFAANVVYGAISKLEIEDIINWNIKEGSLIEVTDAETIKELHKFNTKAVAEHDAEVYVFVRYICDDYVDVVVRVTCSVYPPKHSQLDRLFSISIPYPEPNHYFND